MNLREIINSTRAYNFHSHTQFCDGRADMACFVASALKEGYSHYGFTPHSPIPVASSCNMKMNDVDRYISEFERLKDKFGESINLYMSMEIDYLGEDWGASHPFFQQLPLDYRLSSIHFIPSIDGKEMIDVDGRPDSFIEKMHKYFNDDIRYVVDSFYNRTLDMINAGGFDIIGHFDKIGYNASHYLPGIEEEEWYQAYLSQVINAVKEKGLICEVNTKAWIPHDKASEQERSNYTPRLFPSQATIYSLIQNDIPLVVNSDTHFPERISVGRAEAFEIIDSIKSMLGNNLHYNRDYHF